MSTKFQERGRVGGLTRAVRNGERPADDPELLEARQNLKALRVEEYVLKVVQDAPPLTPEARDRIATILRGGGNGGTA